jgi:glycerol-3-phosphate acyltransferase PlsX
MELQMRIVLDAMGSDSCPDPEITAAVEAARLFGEEIILTGPEETLKPRLQAAGVGNLPVRIVDAPETITMEDKGLAMALKAKRKGSKTSMAIGIDLVKNGQADVFVTAGNTGGALATAYFRLGMLPGVERPALTGIFPVKGGFCTVADIGANPDCTPDALLQFAIMGSIYAEKVLIVVNPRVGLLSNGEEPGKGNELVKHAYPLLGASGLNFIGNVEGKELFGGQVDVVVTDGFTGNVLLKSSEAVAKLVSEILRQEIRRTVRTTIGGLLAKPAFDQVKKAMDPDEIGAIPLLGINGLVFIGHGRSNSRAVFNALRVARQAVQVKLLDEISSAIVQRLAEIQMKEQA